MGLQAAGCVWWSALAKSLFCCSFTSHRPDYLGPAASVTVASFLTDPSNVLLVLVLQMLGRGLRISPGKKDCLVIDFTDKVHNPNRLFEAEMVRFQGSVLFSIGLGSTKVPGLCSFKSRRLAVGRS